MKKLIILTALLSLSACTNTVPKGGQFAYTSKPTFCNCHRRNKDHRLIALEVEAGSKFKP